MRVPVFVAALLASVGLGGSGVAAETVGTGEPVPLAGAPLSTASRLHLLVASNPPFVVDVDTGHVGSIRAPAVMKGALSVMPVAGRAGVIVAYVRYPNARIYVLRQRGARPTFLGAGRSVVASGDGESVWIKSVNGSACLLRHVRLDGRQLGQAQPFACNSTIYYGGSLGLVKNRTRVIDPRSGRTVLRTPYGILAAAGKRLVLAGPGKSSRCWIPRPEANGRLPGRASFATSTHPAPIIKVVVSLWRSPIPPGSLAHARRWTCGRSTRRPARSPMFPVCQRS